MIQANQAVAVQDLIDIHRPIKHTCEEAHALTHPRNATFVVYHYPGTLEQWTFRNDARNWTQNEQAYQVLAKKYGKKITLFDLGWETL